VQPQPRKPIRTRFFRREIRAPSSSKPNLNLKGRIFMTNIIDIMSLAKPGMFFTSTKGRYAYLIVQDHTHAKSSGKATQV
jgi:hypothetical protein